MNIISLIIKREFITKIRNKSFIVMTFVSPMIFIGILALISYVSQMDSDKNKIAVYDETSIFEKDFTNHNKESKKFLFINTSSINPKITKDSLVNNFYEGIVFIPNTKNIKELENKIEYISNKNPSSSLIETVQKIVEERLHKINLQKANIDTVAIKKAEATVNIKLSQVSGEKNIKGLNEIKIGVGGAFGYLIMMFIVVYGNMVMRSVIEEKNNRIVEIIISSVKPFQLMLGKIIGTALAGIVQFVVWSILGFLLLSLVSLFFNININDASQVSTMAVRGISPEISGNVSFFVKQIWSLPIATILFGFIFYFVGGYFLYSSFYAAIGAAVDNQTDSQQFLFPIVMPLILGVYVGFFTVANDPDGTLAVVMSIIPLTSPIVMLMRIPFGVPLWQIVVSLILLYASFFAVVWFAAKIYRIGILVYGKKTSWKELYKWVKLKN